MGYPPETHFKLKSREVSFAHNLFRKWPIVLKFCTEHGSDTAVLCATFQNDWTIETDVMDEREFARFDVYSHIQLEYFDSFLLLGNINKMKIVTNQESKI